MNPVVYYEGYTIRGVSFVPDPELEKFSSFNVSVETATELMEGNITKWFVWKGTDAPALYNMSEKVVLDYLDEYPVQIKENVASAPISLVIKIYGNQLVFCFDSIINHHTDIETLQFVITDKDDPSAVLMVLPIPFIELSVQQLIGFELPTDKPVNVYTRRIFQSVGIERVSPDTPMVLPAPKGHFPDIMRFERKPVERGLQAVLSGSRESLHLALVGGGVAIYARSTPFLRLLFSMPGDPSLVLHTAMVPLGELRTGVTLKLPEILRQPFDLWCPLVYREIGLIG